MNSLVRRLPVIYIVCVPKKYEIGSSKIEAVIREVSAKHPGSVYLLRNSKSFDHTMRTGPSVERIFEHVHQSGLHYIQQVWIVGSSSSVYAREVVRLALSPEYDIPVVLRTPPESCFPRYMEMMTLGKERYGCKAGEGKVIQLSR